VSAVCPSILFNAIPKSASSYITDMLVKGLRARRIFISVGIFPNDLILFPQIQTFAGGGQVAQQHLQPSRENLAYLRHFNVPPVLHVRDPRAVIVSWTHHLRAAEGGLNELFWYYPAICPSAEFVTRSLPWQLDWCLENHLPHFVQWLTDWCAALERGVLQVLCTRFEDFVADRPGFFARLLQHFAIPQDAFADPMEAPTAGHLFRSGRCDEWREVLDATQRRRATDAMPAQLFDRFGWTP
jgi:hypothetical protein